MIVAYPYVKLRGQSRVFAMFDRRRLIAGDYVPRVHHLLEDDHASRGSRDG